MAQGAVVSSEELLDRVWDENADPFTTTVRVTMMTLRRKLGEPADHRHRGRLRVPDRPDRALRRRRRRVADHAGDEQSGACPYRTVRRYETLPTHAARPHGVAVRRPGPPRRRVAAVHLARSCSTARSRSCPVYSCRARSRCTHEPTARPSRSDPVRSSGAARRQRACTTCCTPACCTSAIIVLIGATGGYLLAKQALRPIARLTQTARGAVDQDPGPADQPRRPGRRAARAGRHLRRDARRAWTPRSTASGCSSPTPATNCARRWR